MPRSRLSSRLIVVGFAAALSLSAVALPAAASTGFVIAPFLQHLATNRVQIRFQTDDAVRATVELQGPGKQTRYQDPAEAEFHDVTVDGLQPSTTYTYRVVAGDTATQPVSFTTAQADPSKPFRFLIAGDNRDDPDVYEELVQQMLRVPSDFIVHTGDVVSRGGDRDAWEEYFRISRPLLSTHCQYVAMGNHDLNGKGGRRREPFLQFFAAPDNPEAAYYTFRWGNTRFFVLDTQETWEADERPWFHDRLERSDHEDGIAHRVVVLHHSPFSTGKHGPNRGMRQAGILHMMLEHRVDLVLGGHDHMYERDQFGGVKYIISGGGGAPLYDVYPRASGAAFAASTYHFVEVSVDGDRVGVTARDTKGNVFDSAAYEATGGWIAAAAPATTTPADSAHPSHPSRPLQALPPRASSCGCSVPSSRANDTGTVLFAGLVLGLVRLASRRRPH